MPRSGRAPYGQISLGALYGEAEVSGDHSVLLEDLRTTVRATPAEFILVSQASDWALDGLI